MGDEPPQTLKEYDPEWGERFWNGHGRRELRPRDRCSRSVKVPVLFTHHFRMVDETTGTLMGALSDVQAERVRELVTGAGNRSSYRSFPPMGHSMHGQDPQLSPTPSSTSSTACLPVAPAGTP